MDGAISFVSDLFAHTRDRHKQQQQQQLTSHVARAQQDSPPHHAKPAQATTRGTSRASRDTEGEHKEQGGSSIELPLAWAEWQASALIEP